MPDITMCPGGECPLKEKCHRYLAKPYPQWQSYFTEVPCEGVVLDTGECKYYWPEKREDTK